MKSRQGRLASLWLVRAGKAIPPIAATLGNVANLAIAVVVVVLFFNKDLLHENLRLVSDKVDLVRDKSDLEADLTTLRTDRELVEADLDQARKRQVALESSVEAVSAAIAQRKKELRAAEVRIGRLRMDNQSLRNNNASLKQDNDVVTAATKRATDRLLPVLMLLHLRDARLGQWEIGDSSIAEYLYDPNDNAFRAVTKGQLAAFFFWTVTKEDAKTTAIAKDRLCNLDQSHAALGAVVLAMRDKISISLLDVRRDDVFTQVCKYLGTKVTMTEGRKETKGPIYALLGPSPSYALAFLPGTLDQMSFEEAEARRFWGRMTGILYQRDAGPYLSPQLGNPNAQALLLEGGTVELNFADLQAAAQKITRHDLTKEGLADLVDSAVSLEKEWESYLSSIDITYQNQDRKLTPNGRFLAFLPRLGLADVNFARMFESHSDVRRYKAEIYCAAVRFAVESGHVAGHALPATDTDYDACLKYRAPVSRKYPWVNSVMQSLALGQTLVPEEFPASQ